MAQAEEDKDSAGSEMGVNEGEGEEEVLGKDGGGGVALVLPVAAGQGECSPALAVAGKDEEREAEGERVAVNGAEGRGQVVGGGVALAMLLLLALAHWEALSSLLPLALARCVGRALADSGDCEAEALPESLGPAGPVGAALAELDAAALPVAEGSAEADCAMGDGVGAREVLRVAVAAELGLVAKVALVLPLADWEDRALGVASALGVGAAEQVGAGTQRISSAAPLAGGA